MDAYELHWNRTLCEQWEFQWNHQLRARLDGLTDDDDFWSPVPAPRSVRPRGDSTAPVQLGAGDFTMEYALPEYAGSAATAFDQLETQLDVRPAGVRGLGDAGLRDPESGRLLRDLYLHTKPATNGATR